MSAWKKVPEVAGLWVLFLLSGGAFGFVATCVLAYFYYGRSWEVTTAYVEPVLRTVVPEGVICGALLGALAALEWSERTK